MSMNKSTKLRALDENFSWPKLSFRKLTIYLAALCVFMAVLLSILVSPLLLKQIAQIKGIDWAQLSNIGQTYGAASAVLSAIALIGVSLSLLIQARQAKIERIRITRERHMELLRIILDAPEVYGPVIGTEARLSEIDPRRFIFCTMWVNYARLGYQAGVLTEQILHDDIFGPAFRNEPMRKWWARVRKYWSSDLLQDRKEFRFVQIIDEEYRKAESEGPPIVHEIEDQASGVRTTNDKHYNNLAGVVLGVTVGILIGSRLKKYGKMLGNS